VGSTPLLGRAQPGGTITKLNLEIATDIFVFQIVGSLLCHPKIPASKLYLVPRYLQPCLQQKTGLDISPLNGLCGFGELIVPYVTQATATSCSRRSPRPHPLLTLTFFVRVSRGPLESTRPFEIIETERGESNLAGIPSRWACSFVVLLRPATALGEALQRGGTWKSCILFVLGVGC